MEACLHFRGAALNASKAGISRATEDEGPLRTAVAKAIILPLWGLGHNMLESFGFWRRKFCIKNAEILSVGKIAEFAKFAGGKRRKSPDRFSLIRATASYNRYRSIIVSCSSPSNNKSRYCFLFLDILMM